MDDPDPGVWMSGAWDGNAINFHMAHPNFHRRTGDTATPKVYSVFVIVFWPGPRVPCDVGYRED